MSLLDSVKNIAATVGLLVPLGGLYTVSGLPVPATISQVESRIQPIKDSMVGLQIVVLQQQKDALQTRRNFLRADKFSLQMTHTVKGSTQDLLNQRRLGQIEDEMQEVERRDEVISKKIEELTARPWQEQTKPQKS